MGLHLTSLKDVLANWPFGAVRTFSVLNAQGIYRQLAYKYAQSGWLVHYGYGAYARFGDPVNWLGGVYGLQESGLSIYVGGKTALELQGAGHFIALSQKPHLYLFTQTVSQLPKWMLLSPWNAQLKFSKINLFTEEVGLVDFAWQGFKVKIASPERAILELLNQVDTEQAFIEANYLMEGLGSLKPQLVQLLLEKCKSIKVKRLFLFLAEYNSHYWLNELDFSRINRGVGKRSIIKGGKLDKKYLITVPHSFSKLKLEDIP